jgi:hypothetical protein
MSKTKTTLLKSCLQIGLLAAVVMSSAHAQTIADIVQTQRAKQAADYQKANAPAVDPIKIVTTASKSVYTPEAPKYYLHALITKPGRAGTPSASYAEIVYGSQLISPVTAGMTIGGKFKIVAMNTNSLGIELPGACKKKGKPCDPEVKAIRIGESLN